MNIIKVRYLTFIMLTTISALSTYSKENQYIKEQQIKSIALSYIQKNLPKDLHDPKIDILPLKTSIVLPNCLNTNIKYKTESRTLSHKVVLISCTKPHWQIYVQANIKGKIKVLIATKSLLPQTQIDKTNTKEVFYEIEKLPKRYVQQIESLANKVTKTYIESESVIMPAMLTKQRLIKIGDQVNIIFKSKGISIKTDGTALQFGKKGEIIKVKNNHSKKKIKAQVIDNKSVCVFQ